MIFSYTWLITGLLSLMFKKRKHFCTQKTVKSRIGNVGVTCDDFCLEKKKKQWDMEKPEGIVTLKSVQRFFGRKVI